MWTDAFAAAVGISTIDCRLMFISFQVVHATVVIHAPFSPIVATSKEELEQACVLFARAAPSSPRASQALVRFLDLYMSPPSDCRAYIS